MRHCLRFQKSPCLGPSSGAVSKLKGSAPRGEEVFTENESPSLHTTESGNHQHVPVTSNICAQHALRPRSRQSKSRLLPLGSFQTRAAPGSDHGWSPVIRRDCAQRLSSPKAVMKHSGHPSVYYSSARALGGKSKAPLDFHRQEWSVKALVEKWS